MAEKWTPNRKEYDALTWLFAMVERFNDEIAAVEKRAKATPRAWQMLKASEGLREKALREMMATIPDDHAVKIIRNLGAAMVVVKHKFDATGREGYEDMIAVPGFPLARLCKHVAAIECLMCDKSEAEQKRCKVRRDMVALLPFESDDGKSVPCPWGDFAMREDEDAEVETD